MNTRPCAVKLNTSRVRSETTLIYYFCTIKTSKSNCRSSGSWPFRKQENCSSRLDDSFDFLSCWCCFHQVRTIYNQFFLSIQESTLCEVMKPKYPSLLSILFSVLFCKVPFNLKYCKMHWVSADVPPSTSIIWKWCECQYFTVSSVNSNDTFWSHLLQQQKL